MDNNNEQPTIIDIWIEKLETMGFQEPQIQYEPGDKATFTYFNVDLSLTTATTWLYKNLTKFDVELIYGLSISSSRAGVNNVVLETEESVNRKTYNRLEQQLVSNVEAFYAAVCEKMFESLEAAEDEISTMNLEVQINEPKISFSQYDGSDRFNTRRQIVNVEYLFDVFEITGKVYIVDNAVLPGDETEFEPDEFTDEQSEAYWDENWETIKDQIEAAYWNQNPVVSDDEVVSDDFSDEIMTYDGAYITFSTSHTKNRAIANVEYKFEDVIIRGQMFDVDGESTFKKSSNIEQFTDENSELYWDDNSQHIKEQIETVYDEQQY